MVGVFEHISIGGLPPKIQCQQHRLCRSGKAPGKCEQREYQPSEGAATTGKSCFPFHGVFHLSTWNIRIRNLPRKSKKGGMMGHEGRARGGARTVVVSGLRLGLPSGAGVWQGKGVERSVNPEGPTACNRNP